jgi:hypothetical protein
MLSLKDKEKTLFEMCFISNLFFRISKMGHL